MPNSPELNSSSRTMTIVAQMFRVLLPVQILATATSSLSSIINGILIGNLLEPAALVALGFVVPLNAMIGAISTVISAGSRVLCGTYKGRGESKKIDHAFSLSIVMAAVTGAVLTVIALCFSAPLAKLFGAAGETTAETALYIRGLSFGFIPSLMIPSLMVFLQTGNDSNYSLYSTLVLAVSGLLFSVLSITVFHAGVFGMGFAASLSQYVAALFLLARFRTKSGLMHFDKTGISKKLALNILRIGSPTALAALLYALRNTFLNSIALKTGGTLAVSSLAILNSIGGIFDAVNVGVGSVMLMLASVFIGERDYESMRLLAKYTLKAGLILGFAKTLILAVFGKWIAALFGAEGELIRESYMLMLWYGINMPVNMVLMIFVQPYQALGRVRFLNILYLFGALIIPVGFCLLFSPVLGTAAIWLCYLVADAACIVIFTVNSILKRKHLPKTLSDLLLIDDDFSKGVKLNISVHSTEEVTNVSERLVDFCMKNGVGSRESMICGLCMEEMAVNIIEHGFPKSKRPDNEIDLFVSFDGEQLVMRIRDNAKEFDPHVKLRNGSAEDIGRNVGIKLVSKIATEMNYQSCYGMNVLTISVAVK